MICSTCKKNKPKSEFYIYPNHGTCKCKQCQRDYYKHRWLSMSKIKKAKIMAGSRKRRQRTSLINYQKVLEYLSTKKCKCGESDPILLDFHHKDPHSKKMSISDAVRWYSSWNSILREIKKCRVTCVKCHRLTHMSRKVRLLWKKARKHIKGYSY